MKMKLSAVRGTVVFLMSSMAFFVAHAGSNQLDSQIQQAVDKYVQNYAKQERFTAISASVLIPQNKQADVRTIKTFVAGTMEQAPLLQKITPNDLFDIGSITKSFVTVLILQLHTEKKLSLDDALGNWLPQYPQWSKVTIRQLLNMTSGIPNYSADPEFDKKMETNLNYVWTDEELLAYAHPEKPIKMDEKNLFSYSNSNYILASLVIEKVTQDTFAHQMELLFKEGNLNNTYYLAGAQASETQKAISARKIHGYFYDEQTNQLIDTFNNDLSWAGAAGALVANTEDVVRWVQLLYRGTLIKAPYREDALARMETLVSMETGKPIATVNAENPHGFGLGVGAYYDNKTKQNFWVYQGSTLGFRVMYFWNPCNDVTTAVALNSKAGEGNPNSKLGNHILEANLQLHDLIMQSHKELQCDL
jgi:D-alanyl-D-alanine carboxypeptidase